MKRNKPAIGTNTTVNLEGSTVSRARLANALGAQYGGDRNLYQALGYKTDLKYDD